MSTIALVVKGKPRTQRFEFKWSKTICFDVEYLLHKADPSAGVNSDWVEVETISHGSPPEEFSDFLETFDALDSIREQIENAILEEAK